MIFCINTIPIPRPPTGAASNCREPYYQDSTKKLKKSTYFWPEMKINICCDSIYTNGIIPSGVIIFCTSQPFHKAALAYCLNLCVEFSSAVF
jgi:hypothetical protein